ncbi:hypothetical protein [Comamonas thiooxydans]|uniref:hypothetical protein n=1 Tax=Comamonas thiooxydans TaxID=363952 RepID=UPI000B422C34|nr:hypothetical protein [Comamonas thiooxydans]
MENIKKLGAQDLVAALAYSACGLENILTDADEFAAQVKAAKNLSVLGSRLSFSQSQVAHGTLVRNGIRIAEASVTISGLVTIKGDVVELLQSNCDDPDVYLFSVEVDERIHRMPVEYYPALTSDEEDNYVLADINLLLDLVTA